MGDFNIDIKDCKLYHQIKLEHVIEINDLPQLINKPTRVTTHSASIVDHIYTSTPIFVKDLSIPAIAVIDNYTVRFTRFTGKLHVKRQQHIDHIINLKMNNSFQIC